MDTRVASNQLIPISLSEKDMALSCFRECTELKDSLPTSLSPTIDKWSSKDLFRALRDTTYREVLRHPPDDLNKQGRRSEKFNPDKKMTRISLVRNLSIKLKNGSVDPPMFKLLDLVRRQWRGFISKLHPLTRLRLEHAFQVQLCPPLIRTRMAGRQAICFSVSHRDNFLPKDPVPLEKVNVQYLQFQRPEYVLEATISDAMLLWTDEARYVVRPRQSWCFELPPAKHHNKIGLPIEYRATLANGLAMHEALEDAAVIMKNISSDIDWPELLVQGDIDSSDDDLDQYAKSVGDVSEETRELVEATVQMMKVCRFDRDAVKEEAILRATGTNKLDPAFWVSFAFSPPSPYSVVPVLKDNPNATSYDSIVAVLGHSHAGFVRDLCISEIITDAQKREYFPVRFVRGNHVEFVGNRQRFVRFRPSHFGRRVWNADGTISFVDEMSAIQTIGR